MNTLKASLDKWTVIRDRLLEAAHDSVDNGDGANAKAFVEAASCAEQGILRMQHEVTPTATGMNPLPWMRF